MLHVIDHAVLGSNVFVLYKTLTKGVYDVRSRRADSGRSTKLSRLGEGKAARNCGTYFLGVGLLLSNFNLIDEAKYSKLG